MGKDNLLELELRAYEAKKAEFLKSNLGKYVLIKGSEIAGFFESQNDAITQGIIKFGNTPFLVKKIEEIEQKQNYTSNMIRVDVPCLL